MTTAFQPGALLLGKYRVERVLGQGGMGAVVAARHERLGEMYAIKLMLPEALEDPSAMERFLREARAAAGLRSEHVARVHDVGSLDDGTPYMVMEYLEGLDLKQLLRSRGPLPASEVVSHIVQACQALAEAHARGLVHRDLKPANLFLTHRSSGEPCVKVLDFGIAKDINRHPGAGSDLTKTGTLIGTPKYMSPEQLLRRTDIDARSDVWALGVILFELLTGTAPFLGTLTDLIGAILLESPVAPSHIRQDIPTELESVILRCLEKEPARRFQSVNQLMAALQPFLAARFHASCGEPVPTEAPPVVDPSEEVVTEPMRRGPHKRTGEIGEASAEGTNSAWGNTTPVVVGWSRRHRIAAAIVGGLSILMVGAWALLGASKGTIVAVDALLPAESSATSSPERPRAGTQIPPSSEPPQAAATPPPLPADTSSSKEPQAVATTAPVTRSSLPRVTETPTSQPVPTGGGVKQDPQPRTTAISHPAASTKPLATEKPRPPKGVEFD